MTGRRARIQAVRYFVAFRVVKAAESVFGAVTCCSGCFSAYRRAAIVPHLERWEHQRFLGREATFGDDRALTNVVLRHWSVRYQGNAVSHTIVPATFRRFMRQQLRWKRSWTRESLVVCGIVWRKHPLAAIATYVGIVIPVLSPVVALRAMVWQTYWAMLTARNNDWGTRGPGAMASAPVAGAHPAHAVE